MNYRRLILVEVLLFLFAAVLIGRLFYWQIIKHDNFQTLAKKQTENTVLIGASRGKILASDGSILVSNQKAYQRGQQAHIHQYLYSFSFSNIQL